MFAGYPSVDIADLLDTYDYVVVGGGTAGCVLANRLSRDVGASVLLLERGGIQDSWISRVPLFSSHFASDGSRSWVTKSIAQGHADNREMEIIGGNCLGGSSRINAMLYTRGLPAEFNAWTKSGSWDYRSMEPHFVKSESNLDRKLDSEKHSGTTGGEWVHRSHNHLHWVHSEHIIKATSSMGIPYVEDPNSPFQPAHGCAKLHYSIDRRGQRCSTFAAFLPRQLALSRTHRLHICTNTLVCRIELSGGSEAGAVKSEGVWVKSRNDSTPPILIRARREVIMCAGPIGTPHLLLLSGIGPRDHLKDHGIAVKKDLPGVGSHLQDHLTVPVQFCVPVSDSLAKIQLRPWIILKELFLYLFFGLGLLLSPVLELSVFIQSRLLDKEFNVSSYSEHDMDSSNPENRPDIEIMPVRSGDITYAHTDTVQIAWGEVNKHRQGGLCFFTVMLRPTSMGTIRLNSNDPALPPAIDPNYLSTSHDISAHRKAVRFALRLKDRMVAQGYPVVTYSAPDFDSDQEIDAYVRSKCQSTYHYSSTCRMGPEHAGVVDEDLKVHGVEGLRIADSSVFPEILSTHIAAATVAVAEKCSALLQGPAAPEPSIV
ncbi:GMC oxidoreductase [Mycena metata]|uniref:GMC oxidoreductase n=1 Tax=Mycena metata TaxID=1033252 RepID=A0AAD7J9R9_9AGAR|nr:GMC oxidoreductase [Mycena metata]